MKLWGERKVKIVCTLGPSTSTKEKIIELIKAGMDIVRLNFSHGSYEAHQNTITLVRAAAQELGKTIPILQDLQGPKLRLGKIQGAIKLEIDTVWILYPEGEVGRDTTHPMLPLSATTLRSIVADVKTGHRILMDDGKILTHVVDVQGSRIYVKVLAGGSLTSHKGINVPDTPLSLSCITEKDLKDLDFGLSLQVDAVALSFVRTASEILSIREYIKKKSDIMPLIIPKIERPEAVQDQDAIIEVADAVLVARGDLAVEIGYALVPHVQKELIARCNAKGVPVITATQMLESMITTPTPTRAEASDVANAVVDGTDAVMLSAETASGQYPIESVQVMGNIVLHTEAMLEGKEGIRHAVGEHTLEDAIAQSAYGLTIGLRAKVLVGLHASYQQAVAFNRQKMITPVVFVAHNQLLMRQLHFFRGMWAFIAEPSHSAIILTWLKKSEFIHDSGWIVWLSAKDTLKAEPIV